MNKSIEHTETFNTVSENGIVLIEDYLTDLTKELSILATDGGSNEEVKEALLEKLDRQIETIYQTGNSQLNGQYIYSGILSDIQPIRKEVDAEGRISFHYNGSTIKKDTNVDLKNRQDYGVTGQELFFDSNIFEEFIHVRRLLTEPKIVMEEQNQLQLDNAIDREGEVMRNSIIEKVTDPVLQAQYLDLYDKYIQSLKDWNTNPTEENRTISEKYLQALQGNNPTTISATGGTTIANDFNTATNFISSTNGTYIATMNGISNLELRMNDNGANDSIHIFKKDGTLILGPSLSQTTIDNNTAFFDVGATYSESPNLIQGVSATTSGTEYSGVVDGMNITYSGSTNPGVGINTYGNVGVAQADEVININGMITEDLVLIVSGGGSFTTAAEWDDYSGIVDIGMNDDFERLFNLADIKYTTSEYLTGDENIEYIDPETGIGTGVSLKEHTMDELEIMYDNFISINDQMTREEAYELFNYTKNPFSHQMGDVKNTQDNVGATRAKLGNNMVFLQEMKVRNEGIIISNTNYIDDLTSIRPEEALLKLQEKTLSLQALYQAITSIQKMSLVNYI